MYKLLITIEDSSRVDSVQSYVKTNCVHWCHYMKYTWFIESDKDHHYWTNILDALMGPNQNFIVMDVSSINESHINGKLSDWSYFKQRFPI